MTTVNPFSATRRYKGHQNKVKGLGRNSSYLARFSICFHGSMKKFSQLAKKLLKLFLSSIKTKVDIKFPNIFFFFFSAKNWLGAESIIWYMWDESTISKLVQVSELETNTKLYGGELEGLGKGA